MLEQPLVVRHLEELCSSKISKKLCFFADKPTDRKTAFGRLSLEPWVTWLNQRFNLYRRKWNFRHVYKERFDIDLFSNGQMIHMVYEIIEKLPAKKGMIGAKEISSGIKAGKIKSVIVAKNCPEFLVDKIKAADIEVKMFSGDQSDLGTRLGKPFPVAMVGYE